MKTILILRHAKAEPADSDKKDYQRKLTEKGREDAKAVARTLRQDKLQPGFVLCSAAPRAAQTARLAAPDVDAKKLKTLYAASPEQWMERLRKIPESVQTVLAVGHNPECEDLVYALANHRIEMKTASLAVLQFTGRVEETGARLRQNDGPLPLPPAAASFRRPQGGQVPPPRQMDRSRRRCRHSAPKPRTLVAVV